MIKKNYLISSIWAGDFLTTYLIIANETLNHNACAVINLESRHASERMTNERVLNIKACHRVEITRVRKN